MKDTPPGTDGQASPRVAPPVFARETKPQPPMDDSCAGCENGDPVVLFVDHVHFKIPPTLTPAGDEVTEVIIIKYPWLMTPCGICREWIYRWRYAKHVINKHGGKVDHVHIRRVM